MAGVVGRAEQDGAAAEVEEEGEAVVAVAAVAVVAVVAAVAAGAARWRRRDSAADCAGEPQVVVIRRC